MSSMDAKTNGSSRSANTTHTTATTPGSGWSNGDIPPQLYPVTQDGRVRLYGSQRRWIAFQDGWTRIGAGSHEHDSRHSSSQGAGKASGLITCEATQAQCVRALIAQLCEKFYNTGWATGTGGGVSIRVPSLTNPDSFRVFVAPSGIQKEDMIGDDVFELDMNCNVIVAPKTPNLRQSACTPLWYVVYQERPSAVCVIHTHSIHAQMATLLDPTEESDSLQITHLEMLKGVGNHAYDDVLHVPIIDNRPSEDQLADQLRRALQKYPLSNAVLVRRHGLYCWGDSWEQAKTQCESFDYLFQSAVQMKAMGLNPAAKPKSGSYRVVDDCSSSGEKKKAARKTTDNEEEHVSKKLKTNSADTASTGFHGLAAIDNEADLDRPRHAQAVAAALSSSSSSSSSLSSSLLYVPLLPRDAKCLVLDIEGCTTSIAFVKDVLFPFVRQHLKTFLETNKNSSALIELNKGLASEVKQAAETATLDKDKRLPSTNTASLLAAATQPDDTTGDLISTSMILVEYLMDRDLKTATLKDLQGEMWKKGYESGDITGHVYPDFKLMLEWMKSNNSNNPRRHNNNGNNGSAGGGGNNDSGGSCVPVYIYSSGSIAAQKLLFGHSNAGNLLPLLTGHYDIRTAGDKKQAASYRKIIQDITTTTTTLTAKDIVFVSDSEAELKAAKEAGMGHAILSIRPGNAPITDEGRQTFPTIHSLLQLCGSMD